MKLSAALLLAPLLLCSCASQDIVAVPPRDKAPTFTVVPLSGEDEQLAFAHNAEAALLSQGVRVFHWGVAKSVERERTLGTASVADDPGDRAHGFDDNSDASVFTRSDKFNTRDIPETDYVLYASLQRTGFLRLVETSTRRVVGSAETRSRRVNVQKTVQGMLKTLGLDTFAPVDDTAYVRRVPLGNAKLVVLPLNDELVQLTYAKTVEEGLVNAGVVLLAPPDAIRETTLTAKRRGVRDGDAPGGIVDPIADTRPDRLDVRKNTRKETQRAWDNVEADYIVRTHYRKKKGYECAVAVLRAKDNELVAAFWTPTSSPQVRKTVREAVQAMIQPAPP